MWPDTVDPSPVPSFARPVAVPGVEPDTGPCVCVSFNAAWLPTVCGALNQLLLPSTWATSDADTLLTTQQQAQRLLQMFGAMNGCQTLPPIPPGTTPDDMDCAIAGYLVNEVVREAMQIAINKSFSIGGPQGILFYVLDFMPFANVWAPKVGDGITGIIATIGLNEAFDWVTAQGEQALWDTIGCNVYQGVKSIHGFTDASLATITASLRAIGGAGAPLFDAVADFLDGLGADALNGITSVAGQTHYDCTACDSDTGGPTTTNPPLANQAGIIVKSGATTLYNVRELELESGPLSGTSDDATYTPAIDVTIGDTDEGAVAALTFANTGNVIFDKVSGSADALAVEANVDLPSPSPTLELSDGVTDLTDVSKLTFEGGTLAGTSTDATYTPPSSSVGEASTVEMGADTPLTALAWTTAVSLSVTAGTYLFSGQVEISNGSGAAADFEVRLDCGGVIVAARTVSIAGAGRSGVAIAPIKASVSGASTISLEVYTTASPCVAVAQGEYIGVSATYITAQVPGGGATGDTGATGAGAPVMKLQYTQSTDLGNPLTVSTNVWTNIGPSLAFTVASGSSIVTVYIGLCASLLGVSGATVVVFRLVIDPGGSQTVYPLNSSLANPGYSEAVPTSVTVPLTGIPAGSHHVQLQVISQQENLQIYCRPASYAAYESYRVAVREG